MSTGSKRLTRTFKRQWTALTGRRTPERLSGRGSTRLEGFGLSSGVLGLHHSRSSSLSRSGEASPPIMSASADARYHNPAATSRSPRILSMELTRRRERLGDAIPFA